MPGEDLLALLVQVATLLGAARLLGGLAGRVGLPAIVGELTAGILLGPSVLGQLAPEVSHWLFPPRPEQQHLLDAVAQIGVLLLVGLAGTQVDLEGMRGRVAGVAKIGVLALVLPLGLGVGIGLLIPAPVRPEGADTMVFALFLGVALSVTAIPVIAKTLLELGLIHRDIGQLVLAAGAVDDAVGWLLLAVVSAFAINGGTSAAAYVAVGGLAIFLALAIVVARPLIRHLMRRASATEDATAPTATAAIILLTGAVATQSIGVEAVLGTFVFGLLIGSSTAPPAALRPLHTTVLGVLAPIYFASAGLRINLSALANPALLAVASLILAAAIAGKFAGGYLGAGFSGLPHRERIAVGIGMNARGIVEVVIATMGLRLGILGSEAYTILVLVAVVTSLMAPPLLRWAMSGSTETREERERGRRVVATDAQSALDRGVGE
nr:cation:proton antiporter [Nocardia transvalensis]